MSRRLASKWLFNPGLLAVCALFLAVLNGLQPPCVIAQESPARIFAAHVLSLRAAGVTGGDSVAAVLANMPGAAAASESLPVLFRSFFANTVVHLGRLNAPTPVALYYNPLLDLALFTLWHKQSVSYGVSVARFLPGERLINPHADWELLPGWMRDASGPVTALIDTTAARLRAFRHTHPWRSGKIARDSVTFAAAARDFRAALPRLMWHAVQTTRWADSDKPWLRPTLARIEGALAARNAATITAAAPETNVNTATALAHFPDGFVGGLTLDMVVETSESDRILIASLPDDGDLYVLALCQMGDDTCVLRRFLLLPLFFEE